MSSKGKRLGLYFLAGIFVFGSAGIAMAQQGHGHGGGSSMSTHGSGGGSPSMPLLFLPLKMGNLPHILGGYCRLF